ncbi:MGDG synthase family glycosyltransferase [Virgibacillus necropolis]|uniref:Diacylglycerol glucosyltransferase N-terminal domain-containing protein n=1 Tax=Virgibacillus necropolis TaxID=163877 RepID=A0A221MFM8_9BACI|nr:hypothetical protein [Virgibacillus necropolis]ASN06444.1 hypothetical protein CFK40_16180 [Virgibacillus necropolis]
MFRILFMPLLQIPSGHHHVADSIKVQLNQSADDYHCEEVELLSYSYGNLETLISSAYLQWIHRLPRLYSQIYKYAAVKEKRTNKRFYLYEWLFLKKVQRLIEQTKPDLIICTHSLPSCIIQQLKKRNLWSGPVINVYTDYFINNLWGVDSINYHFVPSLDVKNELITRGIKAHQTFVTGIPIDPLFRNVTPTHKEANRFTVLVSGGNMGAGSIQKLLNRLNPSGSILYKVLCGKNEILLHYIERLNHSHIKPLPYVSSKKEMNQLYDEADAIITKPGGVTVTESLWKKLPIFVYEALPGQEEINLHYLKSQGLIFDLQNSSATINVEDKITDILINGLSQFNKRLDTFYDCVESNDVSKIIKTILSSPNLRG